MSNDMAGFGVGIFDFRKRYIRMQAVANKVAGPTGNHGLLPLTVKPQFLCRNHETVIGQENAGRQSCIGFGMPAHLMCDMREIGCAGAESFRELERSRQIQVTWMLPLPLPEGTDNDHIKARDRLHSYLWK